MYDLEKIPLPLHPMPSPSAPPISYAHTCINDNHAAERRDTEFDMGGALYKHSDGSELRAACVPMVINRTRPEFNNSAASFIEIIKNEVRVSTASFCLWTIYLLLLLLSCNCRRKCDSSGLLTTPPSPSWTHNSVAYLIRSRIPD